MQSMLALVGLALANFAAASPCKPSSPTTVNSVSLTSVPATDISKTSEVPSLSVSESSTATEEPGVTISSVFTGGGFADGLKGLGTEGQVELHTGGCYQADGSPDDKCAALSATGNPAGKRGLGAFASLFQTLNSLNTGRRNKYTVQFYYLVFTAGSQACTVTATFGNNQFYSQSLLNFGGVSMQWVQVLQQVEATSASANFAISMACTGQGISMILVDSIFVSNQVTPENIGDFKLDLGGSTNPQPPATTSKPAPKATTTAGGGGVEEPNTSSFGGGGVEEPNTSSHGGGGVEEPNTSSLGGGGVEEPNTSSLGGGGVEEPNTSAGASPNTEEPTLHTEEAPTSTNVSPNTEEATTHTQEPTEPTRATGGSQNTNTEEPVTETSPINSAAQPATETGTIVTQGSDPETTAPPQIISSTSPPGTATLPAETTKTACKTTCETIDNPENHIEDWSCNVYGVYSGEVSEAPNQDDNDNVNRHYYMSPGECGALCKAMPGCKSAGFHFFARKCFFSNNVVTQSEVREARSDSEGVDWYAIDKCFTCSECDSEPVETTAPEVTPTQAPTKVSPTKPSITVDPQCEATCVVQTDFPAHEDWNCEMEGIYQGESFELPALFGVHRRYLYPEECMEICEAVVDCKSVGFNPSSGKCYGSKNVVTRSQLREAPDDQSIVSWWGSECFRCVGCESHSGGDQPQIETTTHAPQQTTTQAPEQTTFTTRTSESPATTTTTPAERCIYNRGQMCEFNRFKDHSDTICVWGGTFSGTTWTENRQDYPYQDDPYQCIAICQTLENCESAGYYSTENRCLFTSKKLQRSDMGIGAHDFDNSVWMHNSCVTCPTCSNTAPLPSTKECSYDQGDTCRRVTGKDGALCNYQGMWEWYNQQSLDRYPDQSSPAKCAAICQATDYCKGSGYKDGRCMFSFGELKTDKFRDWPDHSRDGIWDDPSCFECPGCTN